MGSFAASGQNGLKTTVLNGDGRGFPWKPHESAYTEHGSYLQSRASMNRSTIGSSTSRYRKQRPCSFDRVGKDKIRARVHFKETFVFLIQNTSKPGFLFQVQLSRHEESHEFDCAVSARQCRTRRQKNFACNTCFASGFSTIEPLN